MVWGAHRERRLVRVNQRRGSLPASWFPDKSLQREPHCETPALLTSKRSSARAH